MEDDLNFEGNGRRPQFFWKRKTTSIFGKIEEDINISFNGIKTQFQDK